MSTEPPPSPHLWPRKAVQTRNRGCPAVDGMPWTALALWAALPSVCPSRGAFSQAFIKGSFRGCGSPNCWHSHSFQLCSFSFRTGCVALDLRAWGSKITAYLDEMQKCSWEEECFGDTVYIHFHPEFNTWMKQRVEKVLFKFTHHLISFCCWTWLLPFNKILFILWAYL